MAEAYQEGVIESRSNYNEHTQRVYRKTPDPLNSTELVRIKTPKLAFTEVARTRQRNNKGVASYCIGGRFG